MYEIDFFMVDAFSDRAFGGNAAAVCLLKEWPADDLLLKMAQQHNQSETAFIVKQPGGFALRWFTTRDEVNLCGHGTLASAHVVFNYLDYPDERVHFETLSGRLTVTRSGEWLTLDFPISVTEEAVPPEEMLRALGISEYRQARQVSARGGDVRCEWRGERVLMSGKARTYLQGKVFLD